MWHSILVKPSGGKKQRNRLPSSLKNNYVNSCRRSDHGEMGALIIRVGCVMLSVSPYGARLLVMLYVSVCTCMWYTYSSSLSYLLMHPCMCVCVSVCVHACACVCMCMCNVEVTGSNELLIIASRIHSLCSAMNQVLIADCLSPTHTHRCRQQWRGSMTSTSPPQPLIQSMWTTVCKRQLSRGWVILHQASLMRHKTRSVVCLLLSLSLVLIGFATNLTCHWWEQRLKYSGICPFKASNLKLAVYLVTFVWPSFVGVYLKFTNQCSPAWWTGKMSVPEAKHFSMLVKILYSVIYR